MFLRFLPALFCAVVCAAQPAQNRLTEEERAAGWKLLFDGTTTTGWQEITGLPFPETSWKIEDECLKAFPNADGMQDLRTVETFRSFDLQFEWKTAKGGNSGVKYLVQKTDRWQRKGEKGFQARARGLEYQLTDDATSAEAKTDATRRTAALYSALAPSQSEAAKPDVFHRSRIVVRGNHVEHWLNGVKVLAFEIDQPEVVGQLRKLIDPKGGGQAVEIRRESPISLQNHNSETWFRNIKVRRLD